MKKLSTIFTSAVLLAITACQYEEPLVEVEAIAGPVFTAQIETFDAETKTALANGNSVVWSAGDQIAIFQGTAKTDTYLVDETCNDTIR